ncbi:MAG: hypothetical protein ACI9OJ_005900, partial [Myxococcota bacterium]
SGSPTSSGISTGPPDQRASTAVSSDATPAEVATDVSDAEIELAESGVPTQLVPQRQQVERPATEAPTFGDSSASPFGWPARAAIIFVVIAFVLALLVRRQRATLSPVTTELAEPPLSTLTGDEAERVPVSTSG